MNASRVICVSSAISAVIADAGDALLDNVPDAELFFKAALFKTCVVNSDDVIESINPNAGRNLMTVHMRGGDVILIAAYYNDDGQKIATIGVYHPK